MRKYFLYFLCVIIFCTYTGCSGFLESPETRSEDGKVSVGKHLQIQNLDKRLILQDNKDTLSADGLYYATWVMGNCVDYQNEEGDKIDLYDAQLYLLLGETRSGADALQKKNTWLSAAQDTYIILEEEEISCNDLSYSLITYSFKNEDSPYDRGVSAFAVYDNCALCIEFTCRKDFEDNPKSILSDFLDHCFYVD